MVLKAIYALCYTALGMKTEPKIKPKKSLNRKPEHYFLIAYTEPEARTKITWTEQSVKLCLGNFSSKTKKNQKLAWL